MTRSQDNPSVQELFLSELVAEPNRYHLYISHACPFSHRVHLVQSLLSSVESQGGGPGPGSNLAALLGVPLPAQTPGNKGGGRAA